MGAFSPDSESVPKAKPKGPGGRKSYDWMLLFKMKMLQQLHNLSDEQTEYQVWDRLSFQRFLRLRLEESVADHTTLWLFRESLAQAKLTEKLFAAAFHTFLWDAGYAARTGQIINTSFVAVLRQQMYRKEREQVNQGKTPSAWREQIAKCRQKDTDACRTQKNDHSFFGYKNHINVDKRHKLIRQYVVTDAAVHDSQCMEALLDPENQGVQVFADIAYRSAEAEQMLCQQHSRIHEKAQRNRPLSKTQELTNTRAGHATPHGLSMPLAPWYSRVCGLCLRRF
ncbi:IS5 family transposase [Acidithiobacillus ferriphilus]|uniref:IS5 family transposase n=1 Tax=Acidithiobacillus ferriphilus TaxID=1689834 RepID=A0ABU6FLR5_9PROT|nr:MULTISPECIES: IS5 family transposase [Acidithiobacillus]MEB8487986.1 IS5 family transposase [Acidithiobacillus ferriphilus]MEB8492457.1 IS5 family transposase [Acidithiobacillus ferriphilus]MEB8512986.1 IS5 family transposase [Acidithiobacillus ferriphilus]MEB8522532.1 IS5 family transposase [Acidithiobacillus ferriphilus]MEB8532610.1 IS5 family transposase [Acidithiobacillus ferriphilus]